MKITSASITKRGYRFKKYIPHMAIICIKQNVALDLTLEILLDNREIEKLNFLVSYYKDVMSLEKEFVISKKEILKEATKEEALQFLDECFLHFSIYYNNLASKIKGSGA